MSKRLHKRVAHHREDAEWDIAVRPVWDTGRKEEREGAL